jgi:hypothetical protein
MSSGLLKVYKASPEESRGVQRSPEESRGVQRSPGESRGVQGTSGSLKSKNKCPYSLVNACILLQNFEFAHLNENGIISAEH